ncbi:MAG: MCE family protein, partial [Methyloprofundus sp.]|nr:MCE family protein [Methyloprofundus sp.]
PVLYKKIQVGQVHDFRLDDKGEYVLINIYITERYAHLISGQSRFWNTSGINVKVGTAGLDIQTGTVDTILTGGIEFITPNLKHKKVKNGISYPLYESYAAVMDNGFHIYKQAKNTQLISLKTTELGSLELGSKLYYKKIPVGKIVDYRLAKQSDEIIIKAEIDKDYRHLISHKTRFWRNSGLQVKADLSGVNVDMASVHSLLNGGVSFANTPFSTPKSQHAYALYKDKQHALQQVEEIQIKFALAEGISAGTAIKYLGIKVGEINRVELADNNQSIIAYAQLINSATDFTRKGTRFYRISAELGLFKNKNLSTLIKGDYLEIVPGKGAKQTQFTAELKRAEIENGLHIILRSAHLGSIKRGNTIFYRQIAVGKVSDFRLSSHAQFVLIDIMIAAKYAALVKSNTRFWNASGVSMDLGLFSGVQVQTQSLESIVSGGIAFATPNEEAANARDNQVFELYKESQAEWLLWNPEIALSE